MQDKTVGQFVDKYFVAAWEQKGNFIVADNIFRGYNRRWGGKMQDENKQGGNVASYFCTPEGRVIHFVAGPVSAKKLLTEMQWAVLANAQAIQKNPASLKKQTRTMRSLHNRYSPERSHAGNHSSRYPASDIRDTLARIEKELSRKTRISAHRYLTYHPLPLLREIETAVFARYVDANVRTEEDEKQLAEALATLAKYAKSRKPAVLVITPAKLKTHHSEKSNGHDMVEMGSRNPEFGVVRLSRDQLPALSMKLTAGDGKNEGESKAAADFAQKWFASTLGNGRQVYVLDHHGQLVSAVPAGKTTTLVTVMRAVLQAKYVDQATAELDAESARESNMKTVRNLMHKIDAWPIAPKLTTQVDDLKLRIRDRGKAARSFKLARRLFRKNPNAGRPELAALVVDFPGTPAADKAREVTLPRS